MLDWSGRAQRIVLTALIFLGLVMPPAMSQTQAPTVVSVSVTGNTHIATDRILAVVKTKAGDVRVAATGASQSGVMRVPAIEAALKANWSAAALDSVKISADGLMSDIQGSPDYRANLIKVMAQRAVADAG